MKFISDLLKDGAKWSLSRVSFVIVLTAGVYIAVTTGDIPVGVSGTMGVLLAYSFANKTKFNNSANQENIRASQETIATTARGFQD